MSFPLSPLFYFIYGSTAPKDDDMMDVDTSPPHSPLHNEEKQQDKDAFDAPEEEQEDARGLSQSASAAGTPTVPPPRTPDTSSFSPQPPETSSPQPAPTPLSSRLPPPAAAFPSSPSPAPHSSSPESSSGLTIGTAHNPRELSPVTNSASTTQVPLPSVPMPASVQLRLPAATSSVKRRADTSSVGAALWSARSRNNQEEDGEHGEGGGVIDLTWSDDEEAVPLDREHEKGQEIAKVVTEEDNEREEDPEIRAPSADSLTASDGDGPASMRRMDMDIDRDQSTSIPAQQDDEREGERDAAWALEEEWQDLMCLPIAAHAASRNLDNASTGLGFDLGTTTDTGTGRIANTDTPSTPPAAPSLSSPPTTTTTSLPLYAPSQAIPVKVTDQVRKAVRMSLASGALDGLFGGPNAASSLVAGADGRSERGDHDVSNLSSLGGAKQPAKRSQPWPLPPPRGLLFEDPEGDGELEGKEPVQRPPPPSASSASRSGPIVDLSKYQSLSAAGGIIRGTFFFPMVFLSVGDSGQLLVRNLFRSSTARTF